MKIISDNRFDDVYNLLCQEIFANGEHVANTKELTNVCLIVKQPSLQNLTLKHRNISLKYANAELEWYWSGDNSCKRIGQYAKKWLDISDDGMTNNSAYGYVMFRKYNRNQLEEIVKLLKIDTNSRRAVINLSDPYLDKIHTKDMQCTIALQFLIRHNTLEMTVYMRSNDIFYGLPYDYIFFESIHQYVAYRLNIEVGQYIHHATSMHCYDTNFEKMKTTDNDKSFSIDFNHIILEHYKNR